MSKLSCEKPYVISKWLKNAGKTYPKLCVWNLSYKRFKCIQNSMLICLCISVYEREGPVLVRHTKKWGYPCVILHLISFCNQSLVFTFSRLLKDSLYDYVTDHFSPLQSNNSF